MENAPDVAFEVALINTHIGASLLGGTGLSRNDAFFNLQANQSVYNRGSALISTC
ncbi:MAG: hypothetical protein Q8Q84_16655 [Hydrogenophaga sp.]|nr:hypothetical protein [Hydrogenophaga sp.]